MQHPFEVGGNTQTQWFISGLKLRIFTLRTEKRDNNLKKWTARLPATSV
jgi:hypothetical protein